MNDVLKTLTAMSELYGRVMSKDAARLLLSDLDGYNEIEILKALHRCRRELSRFPTLAEIIERVDDGRPGIEQAWAMVPKNEYESVVWTDEMAAAYYVAAPLIDQDRIAARQAFKEAYAGELRRAREAKRPARWTASLGHDKNHRDAALLEAVAKNRLTIQDARKLVPELPGPNEKRVAIATEVRALIAETVKGPTHV